MQNQSQHNIVNRSLLRSRISEDEQESMIRYEETKLDTYQWLKNLLKVLLLIIAILLFIFGIYYYFNWGFLTTIKNCIFAPFNWFSWKNNKQQNCEVVKYIQETDKDLEEFKKIKSLRRKFQLSGHSINTLLPKTPNLDHINKHPSQYENITVIKQKLASENLPPKSQLDSVLQFFNNYIPYANINMNSSNQQQKEVRQRIELDIKNSDQKIQKLDESFFENLRFNVKDLNESYKNYLIKKEKIEIFRERFIQVMKQLQQCQKELQNKKNLHQDKNQDLNDLKNQKNQIQNDLQSQLKQLSDLQKALNDLNNQRDAELIGIRQKVSQYQHYVDNEPQIRSTIEQAKNNLEKLKLGQPELMSRINKLIRDKEQKQKDYDKLKEKIGLFDLKKEILEDKIKMHSEELKAAYKNQELHQYVLNLLNKDAKIGYLATLMQNKVQQEESLLYNVEKFEKKMAEIEGEVITDIMKGVSVQEIINAINQDKQDFKNISASYQDLLKKITNLKDVNAEINRLLVLQKKSKDDLNGFNNNYNDLKNQLEKLRRENISLELQIKNLQDLYDSNTNKIEQQEKDITNKVEQLQLALNQYNQIKISLQEREKFYQDKIQQQNGFINSIRNTIDQLKLKLQALLNQISILKPQVDKLLLDYEQQQRDCSSYVQFFYETEKFQNRLEDQQNRDKKILQELQQKIQNSLNVIDADINQ